MTARINDSLSKKTKRNTARYIYSRIAHTYSACNADRLLHSHLRGRLLTPAALVPLRACLAGPSGFSHRRRRRQHRPCRFQGGPTSSHRALPCPAAARQRTACCCCCCCSWNLRGCWTSGQRSPGRRRRRRRHGRSNLDRLAPALRASNHSCPGIWAYRDGNEKGLEIFLYVRMVMAYLLFTMLVKVVLLPLDAG